MIRTKPLTRKAPLRRSTKRGGRHPYNPSKRRDGESIVEFARRVLSYCPESGAFTWAENRNGRALVGSSAGMLDKDGYLVIRLDGRRVRAHRLAWMMTHGEIATSVEIDHRNGRRTDNRIANLRPATDALNAQNIRGPSSRNRLGVLGVSKAESGRYRAFIMVGGKKTALGTFDTSEEAHSAYLSAKRASHEGCSI